MLLRSLATLACTATSSLPPALPKQLPPANPPSRSPAPPPLRRSHSTAKTSRSTTTAPPCTAARSWADSSPTAKVWRTGANEATTLITKANLKIGNLSVPAGTYTLFTLPNPDQWLLIVSKKTGEWGIPYPEGNDLGRTPMTERHSFRATGENVHLL